MAIWTDKDMNIRSISELIRFLGARRQDRDGKLNLAKRALSATRIRVDALIRCAIREWQKSKLSQQIV
jgi:hypothetical protein